MWLAKLKTAAVVVIAGTLTAGGLVAVSQERPRFGPSPSDRDPLKGPPPPPGTVVTHVTSVDIDQALTLSFSPDGRVLALGGFDRNVHIWDVRGMKRVRTLGKAGGAIRDVTFSPDGKTLAAACDDGTISLWSVSTGQREAVLEAKLPGKVGEPVFVLGMRFLPGGKLAAAHNYLDAGRDERHVRILIWDIQARQADTFFQQEGSVYNLAVSSDSKLLAAGVQGEFAGLRVWDIARRAVVLEDKSGGDFYAAAAFDPSGNRIAVGGGHAIEKNGGTMTEGRLRVYDAKTGKELWSVKEATSGSYSSIAFTPDGTGVLTGSSGPIRNVVINGGQGSKVVSELRRWETTTGKLVWQAEGELGQCHIAVSSDGALAAIDSVECRLFDLAGKPGESLVRWKR